MKRQGLFSKPLTATAVPLALFIFFAAQSSVHSENVISDLSQRDVSIEWDFTGAKILLFGAIDTAGKNEKRHDVVITVQGPNMDVVSRKKSRIAGIWVNSTSAAFKNIPAYYSIVSTRPLHQIASKERLAAHRLGLNFMQTHFKSTDPKKVVTQEQKDFKDAVVRILKNDGLYKEEPGGITIIGDRLFRADISLPANVPVGRFTANVYLFSDGVLKSRQLSNLIIQKQGIERTVTTLAFEYPFLYGLACVAIAVLAGMSTSIFARRS